MKKIFTFLIGALFCIALNAQISHDLVIFSDSGLKFTLFMNGEQINEEPRANVKIENTELDYCQVKLVFDDSSIPNIEKKILQIGEPGIGDSPPVATVYRIKNKKGTYKLGFVSRSPKKIQRNIIIIDE